MGDYTNKIFQAALQYTFQRSGFESQKQLAIKAGVPESTISGILKGRKLGRHETQQRIAEALGYSLFDFYELGRKVLLGELSAEEQSAGKRVSGNDIAIRFREIEKKVGLKGYEVAGLLGITPSYYSSLKQGNKPLSRKLIENISQKLGVSKKWLMTGEGDMNDTSQDDTVKMVPDLVIKTGGQSPEIRQAKINPSNYSYVPVIEIRLAAGNGMPVESEQVIDQYVFKTEWLKRVATAKSNLALLFIEGDSMEPLIHHGDIVMIDRGRREIKVGTIFAISINDLVMIKQLDIKPGTVVVSSFNKAYESFEIPINEIRIIGQVIWSAHTYIKTL